MEKYNFPFMETDTWKTMLREIISFYGYYHFLINNNNQNNKTAHKL